MNPGGSVKDRIGYRMVEDAERGGRLKPGCTIIEPTSGNTGIGIAMACAVKGYKCLIVMPEKMSTEKVDALKALGAQIIRTPTEASFDSPEGLIAVAQRLKKETPDSVIMDQYRNVGNPLAHYDGTAEEILYQMENNVDMVVCGAGTGGTICGIGRKIKEKLPNCEVVAADPEGSILSLPAELNETSVNFYEVEGIGYDFVPTVLDRSVVDTWIKSNDEVALPLARRLISSEGLLCGGSSGTALSVALKAAKKLKAGQRCVVILPDGIRNYMTKFVSDNWMEARGLKELRNVNNHKWWDEKVTKIVAEKAVTVLGSTSCKEAIQKMTEGKLAQLVVVDGKNGIIGSVNAATLTTKIVSGNLNLNEPVTRALFKLFRKVEKSANLGLVSRILEKDAFLVVVNEDQTADSVLTQNDFLRFVATQQ